MALKWRPIPGLPGGLTRPTDDGKIEFRREGSIRRTVQNNHDLQKATTASPKALDSKCMGRQIASMPEDCHREMIDAVGNDTDLQRRWLRDKPQYRSVPAVSLGVPKRITIAPGSPKYQDEYARIFPEGDG